MANENESEVAEVLVDLYSTVKYPLPLNYGPDGKDSVTLPPRGRLKGLKRSQLQHPLPAGVKEQVVG